MPPMELSTPKIKFAVKCVGEIIYRGLGSASNHMAWPMPYIKNGRLLRYVIYASWGEKFLRITRKLEKEGKSTKEIAEAFAYPSILARLLFIPEVKDLSRLSQDDLKEIIIKVSDYCTVLQEDLFCYQKGKNILIGKEMNFENLSSDHLEEAGKILSRLGGLLFNYTELLYSFFHNFGHEFQGPFEKTKKNYLFKEFHDLRPSFWRETRNFPADKIEIIESYDPKISVYLDMHNRMNETEPISSKLIGYKVVVDGNLLTFDEINQLLKQVTSFYNRFLGKITLSEEFLSKKYIEATFYSLKRAGDLAQVDWKAPDDLLKNYNRVSDDIKDWIGIISSMPISKELQEMRFNPLVSREEMKRRIEAHSQKTFRSR